MDDRFRDLIFRNLSVFIDGHDTAHGKSVFSRVQGADPVGQLSWQHRNDSVCQINACASVKGLFIECGSLFYIFRDIGDVHAELPFFAFSHQGDRIVYILGVFSVNGDRGKIPVVSPVLPCDGFQPDVDTLRNPVRLAHHLLRKFRRDLISLDNRQDVHSGICYMAKDLRYSTNGILSVPGIDADL